MTTSLLGPFRCQFDHSGGSRLGSASY